MGKLKERVQTLADSQVVDAGLNPPQTGILANDVASDRPCFFRRSPIAFLISLRYLFMRKHIWNEINEE